MSGLLRAVDTGVWAVLWAFLFIFATLFGMSWTTRHLQILEHYAERLWLPLAEVVAIVLLQAWATGGRRR